MKFYIIKRPDPPRTVRTLIQIAAILCALLAAALVILLMGYNPVEIYSELIKGSLASAYRLKATINKTIPLVMLSLGVSVAFKMKFWNIGAEGQMAMGGFAAAYLALFHNNLPSYILLPLMFIAGFLVGGLWALIPAIFKVRFGTSETLVTLMLNYIALKWIAYLQYGPWKEGGFPKIPQFEKNAILPQVLGIHAGWIIALVAVIAVYILLNRSKLGYEISVIGESEATARYAGIDVAKVTLIALLISGGLCGGIGMIQTSAVEKTLTEQFTGGLGFTAAITAWLAKLSAPTIVVVSFLFAMLLQGGSFIETSLRIPSSVAEVLQGLILFFVLGSEFFIQYKIALRRKTHGEESK